MSPGILNKTKKLIKDDKNLFMLALVVMAVFSFFNFQFISEVEKNQQTIIVPLNQSSQFWVSSDNSSDDYLINIGMYVAGLWQTKTPANVDRHFAMILDLVFSENYQNIKEKLKTQSAIIKRYNRNSYSFNSTNTQINKNTNEIFITGTRTRWTTTGKKTPEKLKLIIGYKIQNARFYLTKLEEKVL